MKIFMKKPLILTLLCLLIPGTFTACAAKTDEAGFKSLCKGKAVEAAAPYDRMATGQFAAVYVKNISASSYEVPNISASEGLEKFLGWHIPDEEEEYGLTSAVLCITAVEPSVPTKTCAYQDEEGNEIKIEYYATLFDTNLYAARTGELLDSAQLVLDFGSEECPSAEVISKGTRNIYTKLSTKYTSQPKGNRTLFWDRITVLLVRNIR